MSVRRRRGRRSIHQWPPEPERTGLLGPTLVPIRPLERELGTEVVTAGEMAVLETVVDETPGLKMAVGETPKLEVDVGAAPKLELDGPATVAEVDGIIVMGEIAEPELIVLDAPGETVLMTDGAALEAVEAMPSACEVNV